MTIVIKINNFLPNLITCICYMFSWFESFISFYFSSFFPTFLSIPNRKTCNLSCDKLWPVHKDLVYGARKHKTVTFSSNKLFSLPTKRMFRKKATNCVQYYLEFKLSIYITPFLGFVQLFLRNLANERRDLISTI